jgi:hypothetical protein
MSIKEIPFGIAVVAMLMILFGLAEVVTGFTHDFFGISTSQAATFTYAAAVIGALYVMGGLLILTLKKWAARLAILCLLVDIVGRISLVATGLYPTNSFKQIIAITLGTATAAIFAIYIGLKSSSTAA